jgi:phosphoglycerol transferase MdoB-like AlkP superfamily enzyme
MASKHFDPHTSFIHLPVVKLTVLILFSISIFLSTVIVFKSDIEWDFSYNGFNDALVIFRFPLGILATIIPIVALLAANHRSEQTKEQLLMLKTYFQTIISIWRSFLNIWIL